MSEEQLEPQQDWTVTDGWFQSASKRDSVASGAAKGTEAALRERGALVRRFLTVDSTGVWTDVIEWTDMDAALAAAEAVMAMPDFAPFGAMIDGDSVVMRHAPILWRME